METAEGLAILLTPMEGFVTLSVGVITILQSVRSLWLNFRNRSDHKLLSSILPFVWISAAGFLYLWLRVIQASQISTTRWDIPLLWMGVISTSVLALISGWEKGSGWRRLAVGMAYCLLLIPLSTFTDGLANALAKEAKESCLSGPDASIINAIEENDASCVDFYFWLRRREGNTAWKEIYFLLYAAADANAEVMALLLDSGKFIPNFPDSDGNTALHKAIARNRPDLVCLLVSHDRRFPNKNYETPLSLAIEI